MLAQIMRIGWSIYFLARRDLLLLAADSFSLPEDSDLAVGQIVQAMHDKAATGEVSAAEVLSLLNTLVLPYVGDLANRASDQPKGDQIAE